MDTNNAAAAATSAEEQQNESVRDRHLSEHEGASKFTVVYNKKTIPLYFDLETETVESLKQCVQRETNVVDGMKLMLRGSIIKNSESTLTAAGIKAGAKLLLIGSVAKDIKQVNERGGTTRAADAAAAATAAAAAKTKSAGCAPMSAALGEGVQDLPVHKRILEDGPPADAMPGVRECNEALPPYSLKGMLNTRREPTRLTFKLLQNELWIATSSQTEKVPFRAIRNVMYEPIKGHEEYVIMALLLGSADSERSRFYLYWVPAQYAHAIRTTIMF